MTTQNFAPGTRDVLDGIAKMFNLSDARLKEITHYFIDEMGLGLREYSHPMAMIPTFATHIPNGTEKGTFLALDFVAAVFRVSSVTLDGKRGATQIDQVFTMPDWLLRGNSTDLFGLSQAPPSHQPLTKRNANAVDYLADSVAEFLTEEGLQAKDGPFKLGFTFGFAVEVSAMNHGKILSWSKGFDVRDAIGKDVVELLQDALDRKQLPVRCQAVLNDTVAVLLSECYHSGSCVLGAVFGSGTNGAYMEDVSKIIKLKGFTSDAVMVVNTEWCAFDEAKTVLPYTPFDTKLDRESPSPGKHHYEKMTSGLYLGEIARNIITSLIDHFPPLLFNGRSTPRLNAHYGLDSRHVAMIEGAASVEDLKQVIVDSLEFNSNAVTDQDAEIVRWVCEQVGTRAAKLAGCGVAAILIQKGYVQPTRGSSAGSGKLVVAAEGNLIRFYPRFETMMRQSLAAIVGTEVENRVEIKVVKDGKAVGAALGALSVE